MAAQPMRERFEEYAVSLQEEIVHAFESFDPKAPAFKRDSWQRAQGGTGRSCVFAVPRPFDEQDTNIPSHETVLEKAGVNISVVHGMLPPAGIKQMRADHSGIPFDPENPTSLPFFAAGISLVVHPRNPHAPTVHANYRYFEITDPNPDDEIKDTEGKSSGAEATGKNQGKVLAWWFGGGSDLTPSYLYEEDATHFHRTLKDACDPHGVVLYPVFKKWCDEYFYIPHRSESRGVGGIFLDDLCDDKHKRLPESSAVASSENTAERRPKSPDEIFSFIRSLGNSFLPAYLPILTRRLSMPYTPRERHWQLLRRGRYVEFNLVYDRGTKFGLNTPGARIESILMSLPACAAWEYMSDMDADEGSEEAKLVAVLKKAREWV